MKPTPVIAMTHQRCKSLTSVTDHSSSVSGSTSDTQAAIQSIDNRINHVRSEEDRLRLHEILVRYARLFDIKRPTIATTLDHPPPAQKAYFSTPIKQDAMDKIIHELTEASLIRPSYSPYAAPALLVAKKDAS
jgi:hypothetical protein